MEVEKQPTPGVVHNSAPAGEADKGSHQTPPPAPSPEPKVSASGTPTPPAPEPKAPEVTEEKKPQEFTKAFSVLTKREKAVAEREKAVKDRESDQDYQTFKKVKELSKTSKLDAIKALGFSYEDLTEEAIKKGGSSDKVAELEAKIAQLEGKDKAKEEAAEKDAEKQKLAAAQARVAEFKGEINDFVEKNKETYKAVHVFNAQQLVFDVIDDYHDKHKKILSIEEATKWTNTYLLKEASKAESLKTQEPKVEPTPTPPAPKQEQAKEQGSTRTLTNDHSAGSSKPDDYKGLSEAERRRKIADKYNFAV